MGILGILDQGSQKDKNNTLQTLWVILNHLVKVFQQRALNFMVSNLWNLTNHRHSIILMDIGKPRGNKEAELF